MLPSHAPRARMILDCRTSKPVRRATVSLSRTDQPRADEDQMLAGNLVPRHLGHLDSWYGTHRCM
jgi:hypothetical protein